MPGRGRAGISTDRIMLMTGARLRKRPDLLSRMSIPNLSDDFITGHAEVVVEDKVHAAGAGTVAAAKVVKGQGCKVGGAGFCKEGGDGGKFIIHIVWFIDVSASLDMTITKHQSSS